VPPLRLAWPPPWREWRDATTAWARGLDGLHLGIAGAVALAILLAVAYGLYRVLKWIVMLPVRAVRAAVRAVAHRARRRRAAPPKVRGEAAARLEEVAGLTATAQAAGPTGVSVHEAFVAAGADDCAITTFAESAAAVAAQPDFPGWLAVLTADDPVSREDLMRTWLLEVVRARAHSFLDLHPLIGGRGLRAERDQGDELSDIAFQLISPDGLGVSLEPSQQAVTGFLGTAIERARVHLPNPYALAEFERALAAGPDAEASGPVKSGVPPLATLLFGAAAHQHAGPFADGGALAPEVAQSLDRLRQAGRDVCEGPAFLAATDGALAPGVGAVLVAALSGAMSPSSATLKLRQALGAHPQSPACKAGGALGAKVMLWLAGRERAVVVVAVEHALGRTHLDPALERARHLRDMHGRDLAAAAQKLLGKWQKVSLVEAVLEAHVTEVTRVRDAVIAAAARYADIVAGIGERAEDRVGLIAAGYLCAGLGAAAFVDAPDATRVLIAEAARGVRQRPQTARTRSA
jgi:hypothetical protein